MSDSESKHEKVLKKLQMWLAVLVGVVSLIVGIYNIKSAFFTKKGPGAVTVLLRAQNGQAVPKAAIEIVTPQGGIVATSVTGPEGKYEIRSISPGNYMLKISKSGYEPESILFTVESENTTELDLRIKPAPNSIRSTVEELGATWLKELGSPRPTNQVKSTEPVK